MKKLIIKCLVIFSIFLSSVVYSDTTTTRPVVKRSSKFIEAVIVDNYDLGGDASTTKVYNEAEGTLFYDGAINVSGYENVIYHVDLKTLGSTTVTLTFEGKLDDNWTTTDEWLLLFTKAFTATNANYKIELAEEGLKWVSVGMVSDDGGTDDITIKMRAERKR